MKLKQKIPYKMYGILVVDGNAPQSHQNDKD